jgi:hypothetical protein
MKDYSIKTKLGEERISGWLNIYKKYYLIIDKDDKKNYYPINKTIIKEL